MLNAKDTAVHYCKYIRLRVKRGGETHSPMRQSNLQLQNETALMSCRIRAVEHDRKSVWLDWLTHNMVSKIESCELHKS